MSKKATQQAMNALHELMAKTLTAAIRDGVEVTDKEGNPIRVPASASLLSVARQFLKDNDIVAGFGNKDQSELEKAIRQMNDMPFDDEVPDEFRQH